jgi:hypothetical protein
MVVSWLASKNDINAGIVFPGVQPFKAQLP